MVLAFVFLLMWLLILTGCTIYLYRQNKSTVAAAARKVINFP